MFNIKTLICFFALLLKVNAQNYNVLNGNNWQIGNYINLNFSGSQPVVNSSIAISYTGCTSSISDNLGNILLYSNGQAIYNNSHTIIANGSGLHADAGNQSSILLKRPNNSTQYYLFHVKTGSLNPGLYYSTIDMALSAGSGSVISKNVLISNLGHLPYLTAGKHCNGSDYWLVNAGKSNNLASIFAFSITSSGISNAPATTTLPAQVGGNNYNYFNLGCLKLSPNSRKIGSTFINPSLNCCSSSNPNEILLGDFDNQTGLVSNYTVMITPGCSSGSMAYTPYGLEFSSSSRYAYSSYCGYLCQWDLCSVNSSTPSFIAVTETNSISINNHGSLQLAPDYKIYLTRPGTSTLACIGSPNSFSNNCGYSLNAITLGTYSAQYGLPNFPGFLFEQRPPLSISYSVAPQQCSSIYFSINPVCSGTGYSISSVEWDFGDPVSAANNTSTAYSPTHLFTSNGTYLVRVIRTFAGCTSMKDTAFQQLLIAQPQTTVTPQSFPCSANSVTAATSGGTGVYAYTWTPGGQTNSVVTLSNAGIYTVNTKDAGTNCVTTTTIQVATVNLSVTANTQSLTCNGSNNGVLSATASGAPGAFSYSINNTPSSSGLFANLAAGLYSVAAYNANTQCLITKTFVIAQPPSLQLQAVAPTNTACEGQTITLYAGAGGGFAPITYSWSNGVIGTSQTVAPSAGTHQYTVLASDAHNCTGMAIVSITINPNPSLQVQSNSVCFGDTLHATAFGATTWLWQPGNYTTAAVSHFTTSTCIFTVTGTLNNCSATKTMQASVHPLPNPSLSVNYIPNNCTGNTLQLVTSPFQQVNWSGPAGFTNTNSSVSIFSTSIVYQGQYSLNVVDSNACSSTTVFNVVLLPRPNISINGPSIACLGSMIQLSAAGASTYSWSVGSSLPTYTAIVNSTSLITVTGTGINGCNATATIQVNAGNCDGLSSKNSEYPEVFPNPNNGTFSIQISYPALITIYDASGKLIYQNAFDKGLHNLTYDGANGLYFIKIVTELSSTYTKLIKLSDKD